jgi:hypothetical protein
MRLAPRRRPLVRADRRIAHDQLHAIDGNGELLGNQLRLGGLNALPELAFPRVRCDAAVGGDADPGIELARVDRRPLRAAPALGERERLQGGRAEADDERAGAFEEFAARLFRGGHAVFSRYCLIACSMRTLVKQRHSTPDIACWIWASVALGF